MLFISEGFHDTADDRVKFNSIVTEAVDKLFSDSRHSPYNLLADSFNVWKIFEPSSQKAVTFGPRVNDEDVNFGGDLIFVKGYTIPYENRIYPDGNDIYTVSDLIKIVGLPLRNESRISSQLKTLWGSQQLVNLDIGKISDRLIRGVEKTTLIGDSGKQRLVFRILSVGVRFWRQVIRNRLPELFRSRQRIILLTRITHLSLQEFMSGLTLKLPGT